MLDIARWLARRLWWAMLWLMRRGSVRRAQRWSASIRGEARREATWEKFKRGERFARRWGLSVLTVGIWLLIMSALVTIAFMLVLNYVLPWLDAWRDQQR